MIEGWRAPRRARPPVHETGLHTCRTLGAGLTTRRCGALARSIRMRGWSRCLTRVWPPCNKSPKPPSSSRGHRVGRYRRTRAGRQPGRRRWKHVPDAYPRGRRDRAGRPLLRRCGRLSRFRTRRSVRDIEVINTELILADLESVKKRRQRVARDEADDLRVQREGFGPRRCRRQPVVQKVREYVNPHLARRW